MRLLPFSAWRYTVLVILLFAIVAVASNFIIEHMEARLPDAQLSRELGVAIWSLTMGCLFLAGALGLWAIRSTVEIESRRRIGRFVDAMDYLRDGLLVLNPNGKITAMNPAARQLLPSVIPDPAATMLDQAFPCLTPQDVAQLLNPRLPQELERDCVYANGLRTLRFRSQPSEDLMLTLISDVTNAKTREIRQRQIAQLQLVGRIAGGMAHDFNNILCAISGRAALLQRYGGDPATTSKYIANIIEDTQKGAALSRQLLELSRSGITGAPTAKLPENVREAAELLRLGLAPEWTIRTMIEGEYPMVPLTAAQVEQVVLNLGLLAVDVQPQPGVITITLNRPGKGHLLDVGERFAAVIMISVEAPSARATPEDIAAGQQNFSGLDETGVIQSVVLSLVEEARGRLDQLTAPGGICVFRVCLPHMVLSEDDREQDPLVMSEINAYVARWRVLLVAGEHEMQALEGRLRAIGATVEKNPDLIAVLGHLESSQNLDAIVVNREKLGAEAAGLLKAFNKLCPQMTVVVLGRDSQLESLAAGAACAFEAQSADPDKIIQAMIYAKASLAQAKR